MTAVCCMPYESYFSANFGLAHLVALDLNIYNGDDLGSRESVFAAGKE